MSVSEPAPSGAGASSSLVPVPISSGLRHSGSVVVWSGGVLQWRLLFPRPGHLPRPRAAGGRRCRPLSRRRAELSWRMSRRRGCGGQWPWASPPATTGPIAGGRPPRPGLRGVGGSAPERPGGARRHAEARGVGVARTPEPGPAGPQPAGGDGASHDDQGRSRRHPARWEAACSGRGGGVRRGGPFGPRPPTPHGRA